MGKASSDKSALAREEWDFSQVEDEQLHACFRYELAREIRDFLTYFGQSKEQVSEREKWLKDNPKMPLFVEEYEFIADFLAYLGGEFEYLSLPYTFPQVAWQNMPGKLRVQTAHRFSLFTTGVETFESPLLTERDFQSAVLSGKSIVRLRINWRMSNASLADDFRSWLEQNRPKGISVTASRGRQSLRDDLNALGAMRLRHHYSAFEATELTGQAAGKPLYVDAWSWARASDRAEELFKLMFPKAGPPRSSGRKTNLRGRPRKTSASETDEITLK